MLINTYCGFQFQPFELLGVLAATSTVIEALKKKLDQIKVNIWSIADKIFHVLLSFLFNNNALEKKVDQIKSDIEGIVGKVLQTFAGLNVVARLRPSTI